MQNMFVLRIVNKPHSATYFGDFLGTVDNNNFQLKYNILKRMWLKYA